MKLVVAGTGYVGLVAGVFVLRKKGMMLPVSMWMKIK